MALLRATQADIDRFMSYVDKLPCGCWFWTGGRSRGGGNRKWYGSFKLGRLTVRAHRFSSEVLGGQECPPGHHRDHRCVFSLCVNPDCIEVITAEENQRRKMIRGIVDKIDHNYARGQWRALNDVLAFLNTLELTTVDKTEIYKAVHDMRPSL